MRLIKKIIVDIDQRRKSIAEVLLLFNILDLITTIVFLQMGFSEGNQFMLGLLEYSPFLFIAAKLVLMLLSVTSLLLIGDLYKRSLSSIVASCGLWLMAIMYCSVVASNTLVIIYGLVKAI